MTNYALIDAAGYIPPRHGDECQSIWAQCTLKARDGQDRKKIMASMKAVGIPTTVYYAMPPHTQQAYNRFPTDPAEMAVSEALAMQAFSSPLQPYLEPDVQDSVITALRDALT